MANLRANNVCGTDGRNAITGSVEFDGTGDYLTTPSTSDFSYGTGDFTWEMWLYSADIDVNRYLLDHGSNGGVIAIDSGIGSGSRYFNPSTGVGSILYTTGFGSINANSWYHFAVVRSNGTTSLYKNGILMSSASDTHNYGSQAITIGSYGSPDPTQYYWKGFISNLRVIKGTALYTSNFIPPTRKLKKLPGTVLLCCQDNTSVTTEATGKTITANGNPAARRFVPQVGSDGGLVFDGVTKVNTQNYFYLPTGTTEQQFPIFPGGNVGGSARGLWGGGASPGIGNVIDYVTILTTGNAIDFGDLTQSRFTLAGCASGTRGLFAGGYSPTEQNIIDYVTITSTGNATDFGDLSSPNYYRFTSSLSNSIRGLFGGGYGAPSRKNTIDYITIATTGNAQDFGDLIAAKAGVAGCSSPTRGIFAGGNTPTLLNTIDYVIIQTSGIAVDFGDLTAAKAAFSACSSSTRGIFAGGQTPTNTNVIEYITISTNANAFDFGDLISANATSSGCSSSTRGLFGGGYISPANSNIIEYVTVASTGNAQDFGDLTVARRYVGALSNGHGGLG